MFSSRSSWTNYEPRDMSHYRAYETQHIINLFSAFVHKIFRVFKVVFPVLNEVRSRRTVSIA